MTPGGSQTRTAPSPTWITGDGAIRLEAPESVRRFLEGWVPAGIRGVEAGAVRSPSARIVIDAGLSSLPAYPPRPPDFSLRTACFWRTEDSDKLHLAGVGGSTGSLDLRGMTATIRIPGPGPTPDLPELLTVVIGLLAGGVGRALVHGGAVVAPDERAWILAGPSGSGKSTGTANLIRAGWDYLSDDRIFLLRRTHTSGVGGTGGIGVWVEGWLRPFMLEPGVMKGGEMEAGASEPGPAFGFETAATEGDAAGPGRPSRMPVHPGLLGGGRPRRAARLGGLLFPRVVTEGRTETIPLTPQEALRRLIRESPWLLAAPATAPEALELLSDAACLPAFELSLAPDTRDDPERLGVILGSGAARTPATVGN